LIPLSHDHHHALALCVLTDRALKADASQQSVSARARHIVEKFEEEIRGHFDFEEQVLFPALEAFPEMQQLLRQLFDEHVQLRALVQALDSRPDRATVHQFCELLGRHVRTEEGVLFEQAQGLLTRAQLDQIGEARRGGGGASCGIN
jgi:hemerythrin-like domain-containing protein